MAGNFPIPRRIAKRSQTSFRTASRAVQMTKKVCRYAEEKQNVGKNGARLNNKKWLNGYKAVP